MGIVNPPLNYATSTNQTTEIGLLGDTANAVSLIRTDVDTIKSTAIEIRDNTGTTATNVSTVDTSINGFWTFIVNNTDVTVTAILAVLTGNITTYLSQIDSTASSINTKLGASLFMGQGQKNVTTAGTRVVLGSANNSKSITIKAKHANTGDIYVGDVTVTSANGFVLKAGETVTLGISDVSTVYIDSSVNGEGVSYIYVKP